MEEDKVVDKQVRKNYFATAEIDGELGLSDQQSGMQNAARQGG
jgi:hypothetical protein